MLEDFLTPKDCSNRMSVHVLVYDLFVENVREQSSAKSVDEFLQAAFDHVGAFFYAAFGVGLDVKYVSNKTIKSIGTNPPIKKEQRVTMRKIYAEAHPDRQRSFDMIMYDFSLPKKKRPHFIFGFIGQKEIIPAQIDFFTWPMYLGARDHAGSSGARYCTAGINVVSGLSYTIIHELGHSLGAQHTDDPNCVMQASMIHGKTQYGWSNANRVIVQTKLRELGLCKV